MGKAIQTYKKPLWISLSFLMFVVLGELFFIQRLNLGTLTFTLDDGYIHLALAKNILHGHYGINNNEFASPSSSILWPFLISPISQWSIAPYIIIFINTILAAGTVIVYWKIVSPPELRYALKKVAFSSILLVQIIILTNLIGLIFTGMEHSFQIFTMSIILLGLKHEVEDRKVSWWFLSALVVSPLIRYECLSISVPVLGYLIFRGHFLKSFIVASLILGAIAGFSIFQIKLGLPPIPTSVMAKSSFIASGGSLKVLYSSFLMGISCKEGFLLFVGLLMFLSIVLVKGRPLVEKLLAGTIGSGIILHLFFGQYGWYGRYEIYIWMITIITLIYLNRGRFYRIPERIGFYKGVGIILLTGILFGNQYIRIITTIPIASNNIYEQQYQLHRFVVDYYKKPVAVNDLGYVSYMNKNYVLDLWGLASIEALNLRLTENNFSWMSLLAKRKHVELAMIYENYFKPIPTDWRKIGELHLSKDRITPADSSVSFFALNKDTYGEIYRLIVKFKETLPPNVTFEIKD
jgi:hypothetical protein